MKILLLSFYFPPLKRHRINFWTVNPLWSSGFCKTIFGRIPLTWCNYEFFIQFLNLIDPRLLKSGIFKSDMNIGSNFSVKLAGSKNFLRLVQFNLHNKINREFPGVIKFYRGLKNKKPIENPEKSYFLKKLKLYHDRLRFSKDVFHLRSAEKYLSSDNDYYRLLTLFIYLEQVEKRYYY